LPACEVYIHIIEGVKTGILSVIPEPPVLTDPILVRAADELMQGVKKEQVVDMPTAILMKIVLSTRHVGPLSN
jgi:hypothetical protein